jgi:CheY-like chemotaxis protein
MEKALAISLSRTRKGDTVPKAPPLDLLPDMHLPKSDGEDVLKHLRSTEHYAQTPAILMTGSDSGAIEGKAVTCGAFRKPSNLDGYMQFLFDSTARSCSKIGQV